VDAAPPYPHRWYASACVLGLSMLALAGTAGVASAHSSTELALQVSSSADRSASASLSGATVRGSVYAFLPPPADVAQVAFFLDDEDMSGAPRQVERTSPYDVAGGSSSAAAPLDTRGLSEGSHTLTTRVTHGDGDVVSGETVFTVDNTPDATLAAAAPAPVRLNAGGPAVTTGGVPWSADTYASGGKAYSNSQVTSIAGTTDDALYLTERSATQDLGSFSYAIPAPTAGTYTVRLHFAELWFGAPGGGPAGAGRRVFSANLEGGAVELPDYDIYADVGAATAVVKTFTPSVTDGTLDIAFTARVNQPKVSAIEVLPPSGGTTAPPATGDPTAFSWESRAAAPIGRSEGQGAAVDGKVYAFGGFYTGTTTTARSDVYDTATNTWTRLPDMPEQLTHSPTVVDGKVIWLIGGYVGNHPGPATTSVWKFDTVARTWSRGPSLPARRGAGGAALVGRQLHFFGGTNRVAGSTADPDQPDHWVLDLAAGTGWQSRAGLPNPRNHLTGATVDGKVYAIGGQHNEDESTGLQAQVDRYDPATNGWTRVADLPKARSHTVSVVRDGRILVLGGTNPGNTASSDVTQYDPATNAWARLPSLPGGRKTSVAALVGGTVYLTGGSHATSTYAGRFADRWESGAAMPVALGEVAGGVIGRSLYLVGEGSSSTLAQDLGTGTWRSNLAVRPYVGHHHAAEVLGGKLYLLGGLGSGAGKVQIYDPAANAWSTGPDIPFAAGSSATAVIGGRIYVAGGITGSTTTDQVARFDPATRTWTRLAPMPQGRNHAAATTDGTRLYVFGGRGAGNGDGNTVANGFDTVQVYDPATGTWASSATPGSGLTPLPQARGGTGKAVSYRGEMYVMGGETATGAGATDRHVYRRVDVYDPATSTWRQGTPMLTGRHGIFPLLYAGRITVAGGGVQAGASTSSQVETYNPLH